MLNVGLVTASLIPSPCASPCTKVVLPTPRLPCNASVESGGSSRASSAASARVSSAEPVTTPAWSWSNADMLRTVSAEVLVTVEVGQIDRSGGKPPLWDELADSRQSCAWERPPPPTSERVGVRSLRHHKQELVVFA